nr:hypothetical protein [Escherichia coli]
FAGKKSAQIREILISESTWEEMTCLFAPSLKKADFCMLFCFCEAFSRNNKSVAVVSFITQKWFSYRPG